MPRQPEPEYDEDDDLPVIEDILSKIRDLPDLEEASEITVDDDLSELEELASDIEEMPLLEEVLEIIIEHDSSDTDNMPPLEEVIEITIPHDFSDTEEMPPLEPEDVPYGESPFNNDAPIRRDTSASPTKSGKRIFYGSDKRIRTINVLVR